MQIGIVGLPNAGKSALFKAMTGMAVEVGNYPFPTTNPTNGSAPVPDPRLQIINQYIPTKKVIPATIDLVDIPAIVTGASHGEGMGNAFLEHIRQVDALAHVVRCFDDSNVVLSSDTLDPVIDAETVETELLLADLQVLESALPKAERRARIGNDPAATKRVEVAQKAIALLEEERPLRFEKWNPEESKELKALGMITLRPVLYVANVEEDDLTGASDRVQQLKQWVVQREGEHAEVVPVSAELEAEIAEIEDPEEHDEMLHGLGLDEPARAVLARALYRLIGLQSFYTAGPKEIRAWPLRIGASAPEAAGTVHSDMERGFIRCETHSVNDLVEYKTEQAIKAAGKLRVEGKQYTMQDGDCCHFLFNV